MSCLFSFLFPLIWAPQNRSFTDIAFMSCLCHSCSHWSWLLQTDLTTKWISCSILSPTLQTSTSPDAIVEIHQHCHPNHDHISHHRPPRLPVQCHKLCNLKILRGFYWHYHIFSKVSIGACVFVTHKQNVEYSDHTSWHTKGKSRQIYNTVQGLEGQRTNWIQTKLL